MPSRGFEGTTGQSEANASLTPAYKQYDGIKSSLWTQSWVYASISSTCHEHMQCTMPVRQLFLPGQNKNLQGHFACKQPHVQSAASVCGILAISDSRCRSLPPALISGGSCVLRQISQLLAFDAEFPYQGGGARGWPPHALQPLPAFQGLHLTHDAVSAPFDALEDKHYCSVGPLPPQRYSEPAGMWSLLLMSNRAIPPAPLRSMLL